MDLWETQWDIVYVNTFSSIQRAVYLNVCVFVFAADLFGDVGQ